MAGMPDRGSMTVLGCGLMGSGVARAFARTQGAVTVWNRTAEKAQALTDTPGITVADTPESACEAHMIISVLEGYDTVRAVLATAPSLAGKTIVNLTTGTQEDAVEMREWVDRRGATYLDGTILCYPQQIGTPEGLVVYSGSRGVFNETASLLMILGDKSRYVSAEVGAANVAATGSAFFITALTAFAESASYILDAGVPASDLQDIARSLIASLPGQIEDVVAAIATQAFSTEHANVNGYAGAMTSFQEAMRKAGAEPVVLSATAQVLVSAQNAGHGELAIACVGN